MDKDLFLTCSCHGEGIRFNYDKEIDGLEISFYQQGYTSNTKSLREKLRWIWHILKNNKIYGDQVILNKESLNKLTQFVNEISPNNTSFANSKTPNKELKVGTLYILEGESLPFRYIKYLDQKDNVYNFKHHKLKMLTFNNTNSVIREANQNEINLYDSLKEEINNLADRIY